MKNVFNGLIRRLNMAKGRLNDRKTGQKKLLKLQHYEKKKKSKKTEHLGPEGQCEQVQHMCNWNHKRREREKKLIPENRTSALPQNNESYQTTDQEAQRIPTG